MATKNKTHLKRLRISKSFTRGAPLEQQQRILSNNVPFLDYMKSIQELSLYSDDHKNQRKHFLKYWKRRWDLTMEEVHQNVPPLVNKRIDKFSHEDLKTIVSIIDKNYFKNMLISSIEKESPEVKYSCSRKTKAAGTCSTYADNHMISVSVPIANLSFDLGFDVKSDQLFAENYQNALEFIVCTIQHEVVHLLLACKWFKPQKKELEYASDEKGHGPMFQSLQQAIFGIEAKSICHHATVLHEYMAIQHHLYPKTMVRLDDTLDAWIQQFHLSGIGEIQIALWILDVHGPFNGYNDNSKSHTPMKFRKETINLANIHRIEVNLKNDLYLKAQRPLKAYDEQKSKSKRKFSHYGKYNAKRQKCIEKWQFFETSIKELSFSQKYETLQHPSFAPVIAKFVDATIERSPDSIIDSLVEHHSDKFLAQVQHYRDAVTDVFVHQALQNDTLALHSDTVYQNIQETVAFLF